MEKEFLSIKFKGRAPTSAKARALRHIMALDARIKFLKKSDFFHYGGLEMPDPETDPEVSTRSRSTTLTEIPGQLWEEPDFSLPFQNPVIGEIMARKWWKGPTAEASRKEYGPVFDLRDKTLSANLIALVCCAISVSSACACKSAKWS